MAFRIIICFQRPLTDVLIVIGQPVSVHSVVKANNRILVRTIERVRQKIVILLAMRGKVKTKRTVKALDRNAQKKQQPS